MMLLKMRHHSDATLSVTLNGAVSGVRHGSLVGWGVWVFQTKPIEPTVPTDKSSITVKDDYGIDLLGGSGASMVDNSTLHEFYAKVNSLSCVRPVIGDLTVATSGNSVNYAWFYLRVYMVGV